MILPKFIYNVLNHKKGFDNLFMWKLKESETMEAAYLAAVEYIREYIPNFKEPYKGFDSYRSKHHLDVRGEINIPDDVVDAYVNGINAIFEQKFEKLKVNQLAYEATMKYINQHLPDFKPYANYQSFRSTQLYKRRVEIKKRKRNQKD